MSTSKSNGVYIKTIVVTDPDSNAPVEVEIWKDKTTAGMFGVDASFLECEDGEYYNPFTGDLQVLDAEDVGVGIYD